MNWQPEEIPDETSEEDTPKGTPKETPKEINANYNALRREIEDVIHEGFFRNTALKHIQILDCAKTSNDDGFLLASCDLQAKEPKSVGMLRERIEKSVDKHDYQVALADSLAALVCGAGSHAIHILRGLLRDHSILIFPSESSIAAAGGEAANLVGRLQSKDCPVSSVLTDDDRADLRKFQKPPAQIPVTGNEAEKKPIK